MDRQNIWFPYDDFEIWSGDQDNATRAPPSLTKPSNWTEHASSSSIRQPSLALHSYTYSHPVQSQDSMQPSTLDRHSSVRDVPPGHLATGQKMTESALPAYDTYWQSGNVASRGESQQEQGLVSSISSAPSRVSVSSVPSHTIMEHAPISSSKNITGESALPARSHGIPSSQGGSVLLHYPYPPTEYQGVPTQAANQPSSALHAVDEGFVKMSFPLQTTDHLLKREALRSVMLSSWKLNNQFEPNASLLLQFMRLDPGEGRWYCSFWKDGKACGCSCKKKDHAKGHIRSHIDLLPYICSENCPMSNGGCGRRYPAIEPLQKHRKGKAICEDCGMSILPANLKRHMTACPGRAASEE